MNSILDACALLAFLNDEEGADVVESLLNQAASGETVVFMSTESKPFPVLRFFKERSILCDERSAVCPKSNCF
jgi:uncharacterized protein with PIN domain